MLTSFLLPRFQVIRIEWLHAKASLERWVEEEGLLAVESQRVVRSFLWECKKWVSRVEAIFGLDGISLGQKAFCWSQVHVYASLAEAAMNETKSIEVRRKHDPGLLTVQAHM